MKSRDIINLSKKVKRLQDKIDFTKHSLYNFRNHVDRDETILNECKTLLEAANRKIKESINPAEIKVGIHKLINYKMEPKIMAIIMIDGIPKPIHLEIDDMDLLFYNNIRHETSLTCKCPQKADSLKLEPKA